MAIPTGDEETEVIVVINDDYYSGFDKMVYHSLLGLGILLLFAVSVTAGYEVVQYLLR